MAGNALSRGERIFAAALRACAAVVLGVAIYFYAFAKPKPARPLPDLGGRETPAWLTVRLYDVDDLIQPDDDMRLAIDQLAANPGSGSAIASSTGVLPPPPPPSPAQEPAMEEFVALMKDVANDDEAASAATANANFAYVHHTLIVHGDGWVQRNVQRILRSLREASANSPKK